MRKVLSLLAIFFVFFCFSGCGNSSLSHYKIEPSLQPAEDNEWYTSNDMENKYQPISKGTEYVSVLYQARDDQTTILGYKGSSDMMLVEPELTAEEILRIARFDLNCLAVNGGPNIAQLECTVKDSNGNRAYYFILRFTEKSRTDTVIFIPDKSTNENGEYVSDEEWLARY